MKTQETSETYYYQYILKIREKNSLHSKHLWLNFKNRDIHYMGLRLTK